MGYYIRGLTAQPHPASPAVLVKGARAHNASVTGDVDAADWDQLLVTNSAGQEVCAIERNVVATGSLGEEELVEFQAEIAAGLPASAATWLRSYLQSVRTIYAFQICPEPMRTTGGKY